MGCAIAVDKFTNEKRHIVVPRHIACSIQIQARQCIWKAMLPACDGGVVVALVGRVPTKHHVTKSKTACGIGLCCAFEFVDVQILATQNAVDVADGHFDFLSAAFFNRFECRVYFGGGHADSFRNSKRKQDSSRSAAGNA